MSDNLGIDWTKEYTEEELKQQDTDTSVNPISVKKQPITAFADNNLHESLQEDYRQKITNVLLEFEAFLYNEYELHPCNVSDDHIKAFNEHLKSGTAYYMQRGRRGERAKQFDVSPGSRSNYFSYIKRFYSWLEKNNVVSENPAQVALDSEELENDLKTDDKDRPVRSMEEMTAFLRWCPSPFHRAYFLVLLKSGVRAGELRNIDLRDLHLDHPLYKYWLEKYDISLVEDVANKPDSVYIMGGFNAGTEVRGEVREAGNKRSRDDGTVIPIDPELKTALLEYVLTRPAPNPDVPCHPLFVKERDNGDRERITDGSVQRRIFGLLEEYEWYEQGAGIEEKIDNHYFRHYFTYNHRHLRGVYDNWMPDGLRAYLRGDKDSSDDDENSNTARNTVYSHSSWDDWNRTVREPYMDSIYYFGVYE